MRLRIFTDGACSGNPGPGGWAAIFNMNEKTRKISGYEKKTTNNRMELIAVVKALQYILCNKEKYKDYRILEIYSDSAYVINGVNKGWIANWKKNSWKTSKNEDVKNAELWKELDSLLDILEVEFIKVKGHKGILQNEMADEEAKKMAEKAKSQWR